jgi:tetratricopeptide (TPR) repeat protein
MPRLIALLLLAAGATTIEEAERLASTAIERAASQPEPALAQARKAIELTLEFQPTAYVRAGRKGEVVEDEYVAARTEYRRHRSRLYAAAGACLAAMGRHDAAVRYLRRANDLDPAGGSVVRFARSLVALGQGRAALDALLASGARDLGAETVAVAQEAADVAGYPSVQAEIDRVRINALQTQPKVEYRDGPIRLPAAARLSTGGPFDFDSEKPTFFYVAEPACETCSADLEAVKRLVPAAFRIVLLPSSPDRDEALRSLATLYRYNWSYVVGPGLAQALGVTGPSALIVARRGFSAALVRPPFHLTLPAVLEVLQRADLSESVPRAAWNRRPVDRKPLPPRPKLLDDGLAPGEDDPPPAEFASAVAAFRNGKPAEALRLFEALEAKGDGWLLPPEARLDRALCLAALGRRDEARRLLLHTGDSRFQEDVDRALERVGSPPKRGR